jgi:hypothetical protein
MEWLVSWWNATMILVNMVMKGFSFHGGDYEGSYGM